MTKKELVILLKLNERLCNKQLNNIIKMNEILKEIVKADMSSIVIVQGKAKKLLDELSQK